MGTRVQLQAHMGGLDSGKKSSGTARLIGSACAGVSELLLFHPVDTVAKRLMYNENPIMVASGQSFETTVQNLNKVIFRDAYGKGVAVQYKSLFPGLGFAAGY